MRCLCRRGVYHSRFASYPTPNSTKEPSHLTEKQRKTTPLPLEFYSFTNYVAYALYPPLYIAGPIMTFNDFFWQVSQSFSVMPFLFLKISPMPR